MGIFDVFGSTEKKLIKAAGEGDINTVNKLINDSIPKKKIDLDAEDKDGKTAIIRAAMHGYSGIISLLIENGASVDSRDKDGRTPLIISTIVGNLEAVKLLVENGANVNAKGWFVETAVLEAAERGFQEIYDYLMEMGGEDPRHDKKVKQRSGTCIVCSKTVGDTILAPLNYSDTFVYKCGSCDVIYCMDCDIELRKKTLGACVNCGEGVNNIRKE